jgi:HEAT repeat protein
MIHMKLYLLVALAASVGIAAPPAQGASATHEIVHGVISETAVFHPLPAGVARDPADSLYRAAREVLGNGDYDLAARMFHDVGVRYPQSALIPDAMYYEAFAKYRSGGSEAMLSARDLLASLQKRFPDFGQRSDAETLSTRICGELARQGDASCAASISARATSTGIGIQHDTRTAGQCPDNENDERVAALNALLQMDAVRAEPILEKVLARRDACSAVLRRKAVFLVAQKQSSQAADVLLRVAQSDPDPEVRSQAVFWISQVPGERAASVLSGILRSSSDMELRKKALFALGQSHSEQATQLVREYAGDAAQPAVLRETAIFWLGQKNGAQNVQFLRDLYGKLTDDGLKEKLLFSLSQSKVPDRTDWLLQLAQRPSESIAMRKKALFFAGQSGASISSLSRMYDGLPAGELREQMIFVFSQSQDPAALDKIIAIVKSDKDAAARKKALFWLGQSHDPRAMKALTEVIDK